MSFPSRVNEQPQGLQIVDVDYDFNESFQWTWNLVKLSQTINFRGRNNIMRGMNRKSFLPPPPGAYPMIFPNFTLRE